MAKAISYRRFSSGAQATGDSLKRQTEAAQAYCDAHGDELDVSFVDAGMSAYRGKNATQGALARLVELAEQSTFAPGTKLIVEHLDRLSRADVPTAQEQFTRILRSGLTIVTLMDGQIYTYDRIKKDIGALLISIVLMFNANQESVNKGARVAKAKASRLERVRAGEEIKMTRQGPGWLRAKGSGEKLEFVPIPERVEVVRRIFDLSLAGLGKRAIMSILNREGVRPFRGGDGWHQSSVSTILANSAVIGHFRPTRVVDGKVVRTGEIVPNYFPSILDEATFYRAREATARRQEPRAAGRKSIGLANLFSGLGKCGHCGAHLAYETRGNSRHKPGTPPRFKALVCDRAARHNGCGNDYRYPYEPVERGVFDMLTLFDLSTVIGKISEPDAQREAELEGAIGGKTAEIDHLVEAFGREPLASVKRRIETLDSEIEAHNVALEAHRRQARIADANRDRDQISEFRKLVENMGEEMTDTVRFLLRVKLSSEIKRLVSVITTDGKDLIASIKSPATPTDIRLQWIPAPGGAAFGSYQIVYLPLWGLLDVEGFRPPTYTEPPPVSEVWTAEELAEWKSRG